MTRTAIRAQQQPASALPADIQVVAGARVTSARCTKRSRCDVPRGTIEKPRTEGHAPGPRARREHQPPTRQPCPEQPTHRPPDRSPAAARRTSRSRHPRDRDRRCDGTVELPVRTPLGLSPLAHCEQAHCDCECARSREPRPAIHQQPRTRQTSRPRMRVGLPVRGQTSAHANGRSSPYPAPRHPTTARATPCVCKLMKHNPHSIVSTVESGVTTWNRG